MIAAEQLKRPWMLSTKSLFFYLPPRNSPVCDVNELIVHVIFRKEMETHQAPRPGKSNLFFRCTDISLVHQILILIYGKHPREGRRGSGGAWSTMWSVLVSTLDCGLGTCPEVHTYPFVGMSVGAQTIPDSQIHSYSAGIETWACAERSQPAESFVGVGTGWGCILDPALCFLSLAFSSTATRLSMRSGCEYEISSYSRVYHHGWALSITIVPADMNQIMLRMCLFFFNAKISKLCDQYAK